MTNFEQIKKILVEQLELDEDIVTPETTIEDLGVDSLDLVEAVMTIEDTFNIKIEDTDLESLKTVNDFVKYVENK